MPHPRKFRKRWQDEYVIVDVMGNKVGNLAKTTTRFFIATDGTKFERDYQAPSRYSIVRKSRT